MYIDLTEDERDGLIEAIDRALDDRRYYLQSGSPESDYGDEWPETAREEARRWMNCASALRKFGVIAMADACENIASSMEASAYEYRNAEVGN